MPSLTMNNLDTSKKFSLHVRSSIAGTFTNLDNMNIDVSGATTCNISLTKNASNESPRVGSECPPFLASTSTLTFSAASVTSPNYIQGSGDSSNTYVILCQLPDSTIINSNKWD
jgi:hypothetical protein